MRMTALDVAVKLLAALTCLVCMPGVSFAQDDVGLDLPPLQLQRFRPAPGPADFLNVYGSPVAEHLDWDIGFYFDVADRPLALAVGGDNVNFGAETIDTQSTLSLMGNIGFKNMFEFGILLPITVYQTSEVLQPAQLGDTMVQGTDLPGFGVNDLRLSAKYRILDILEKPLGLAWVLNVYAPTATRNRLTSDEHVSVETRVAGDKFLIEGFGLRVAANLGYRFRAGDVREFRGNIINDEFLWGLAASLPVAFNRLDLIAEIDGGIGIAKRGRALREGEVNAEAYGGARYKINERWTLTGGISGGLSEGVGTPRIRALVGLGGYWVTGTEWGYDFDGDGIYGKRDLCPQQAEDYDGHEDFDGCPDLDNDGDGVLDDDDKCDNSPEGIEVGEDGCPDDDLDGDGIPNKYDKCPEDPEDRDRFEDGDGCPDPDNDKDGIPDTKDSCPNEPENMNGFLDEDGCPDDPNEKVVISNNKIIITEPVYFATNKDTILKQSYDILNEVARVLQENPQIQLVRVEGHTDDRGKDAYNQKLSQRRAESVRKYLMDKGIARERLEAVGYGKAQPISENETPEGRAKNRRVEFTIVEQ